MELIEITGQEEEFTRRQRWSHALTVIVGVVVLLYGLNMRAGALYATTIYDNAQAGIRANYPQNWLLDESGDYVLQVRDMARIGFKTTILIATQPIGPDMTERNVLDTLNITRPPIMAAYNILSIGDYMLPDGTPATAMNYTYVAVDANPFLESVPAVVLGQDIITIRGGQAIIITFRADAQTFEQDLAIFNRFLASLEF